MLSCCLNRGLQNPFNVTLIPKEVTINDKSDNDSDDDEDDVVDFSSHNGCGGLHDTFFDIDFLQTDQNDGTSRMKLPVHCNMEAIGIEFGEGVVINWREVQFNWKKVQINLQTSCYC